MQMYSLLAAIAIMLVSLIGVIFTNQFLRVWLNNRLSYLVSLSAGVFFITALFLIQKTFHLTSPMIAIGTVVSGFVLFLLGQALVPESHHHHEPECVGPNCPVPDRKRGAWRMIIGDGIHNIGDGILLVPAFMVSIELGIAAAVSIFVHELLQEISEFFVLRQAGYTTGGALSRNFAASATILIGVGIGWLLSSSTDLQGVLLGLAAGGFLFIVFHDLFPYKELSHANSSRFWKHFAAFAVGIVVLGFINTNFGHVHLGEQANDEHQHENNESPNIKHQDSEAQNHENSDGDLHNENTHQHRRHFY